MIVDYVNFTHVAVIVDKGHPALLMRNRTPRATNKSADPAELVAQGYLSTRSLTTQLDQLHSLPTDSIPFVTFLKF